MYSGDAFIVFLGNVYLKAFFEGVEHLAFWVLVGF
jgi:hypothetical protein